MTNLQKIGLALSKGKIGGAKALLVEYYLDEDKAKWDSGRRDEYDELFPIGREPTDEEKEKQYNDYLDKCNHDGVEPKGKDNINYVEILIDYSEDGDYLTFTEYLNETKVVQEAELDVDGNTVSPEVTELVRQYTPIAPEDLEAMVESYGPLVTKKREMTSIKYRNQAESMLTGYEQYERDTFNVQEAEAKAYKADSEANVPMITAIAVARGVDVDVLVDKILTKSDLFKTVIGSMIGAKQKELG